MTSENPAKEKYIEYVISTSVNYTCSNLAAHLEKVSHAAVTNYLRRDKLTARGLWERVQPLLNDSPHAYLLVDDSVQDKRYSHKIELVKRHYSGNEHGLVKGIGVVNLVHSEISEFDINPLIATAQGNYAVDALIILNQS